MPPSYDLLVAEEFVAAGDFLTYKFPTWTWSSASSSDAKYTRDFLPSDKQYLISRGVPCLRRVSQMEKAALGSSSKTGQANSETDERLLNFGEGHDGDEVAGKGTEEDWLATHLDDDPSHSAVAGDIADIPDSEPPMASLTPGEEDELASRVAGTHLGGSHSGISGAGKGDDGAEIGDIPDMDDEDDELGGLGEGVVEADDPATANVHRGTTFSSQQGTASVAGGQTISKLISVRTYDCLITYDKYYQTPRMWLVGYNESGQPLKPAEIFEDVSSDYAQKTVTVEPFPHGNLSTASIHPCKHASVMKKVIERMNASVIEEQKKANNSTSNDSATKKKKGWGLGGAMKKISGSKESAGGSGTPETGSHTPSGNAGNTELSPNTAVGDEEGQTTEVEGLRVDQYLLIFLKFMASIVPAIEIDATQAV